MPCPKKDTIVANARGKDLRILLSKALDDFAYTGVMRELMAPHTTVAANHSSGKLLLSRRRMRTHNCRPRARRNILQEELVVNSRRNILQPGQRLQSQRALIVLRLGDRATSSRILCRRA
jgi:hypothetical protein